MASSKRRASPVPAEVTAYRLDEDDMVVFVWDSPKPDRALTAAEREVLRLLQAGTSNADIAKARGTSLRTVANQVAGLLRKLGAASRFELIARGVRTGGEP